MIVISNIIRVILQRDQLANETSADRLDLYSEFRHFVHFLSFLITA